MRPVPLSKARTKPDAKPNHPTSSVVDAALDLRKRAMRPTTTRTHSNRESRYRRPPRQPQTVRHQPIWSTSQMTRPTGRDAVLITVTDLHAALQSLAPPAVLDVRWALGDPSGHRDYLDQHIPGARFVDLERELSAPPSPQAGRHPLPAIEDLQRAARGWGVYARPGRRRVRRRRGAVGGAGVVAAALGRCARRAHPRRWPGRPGRGRASVATGPGQKRPGRRPARDAGPTGPAMSS